MMTMIMLISILLLPAVFLKGVNATYGFQSGPSPGASYASGLVVDLNDQVVYLTGLQYNQDFIMPGTSVATTTATDVSTCYLAKIKLTSGGTTDEVNRNKVNTFLEDQVRPDTRSSSPQQETCAALAVPPSSSSELLVVGTKETTNAQQIPSEGMLMVLDTDNLQEKALEDWTLVGQENPTTELVYPVTMTTEVNDDGADDYVYFASLTSTDAVEHTNSVNTVYPDWFKHPHYGSAFEFHVTKLKLSANTNTNTNNMEEEEDDES